MESILKYMNQQKQRLKYSNRKYLFNQACATGDIKTVKDLMENVKDLETCWAVSKATNNKILQKIIDEEYTKRLE